MKLNDVDFNKVAVYCQIVESGNYQRASEALGVTPSALSQTVTRLESGFGFLLFDRIGKKLVPTRRGLQLHREFRRSQSGFLRALTGITGQEPTVSGILRVGAYLEFTKARLTGLLKDFTQEFPNSQIKMVFDTPTRLQDLLSKGQLDLCFSIFPARESKRITSQAISQEELVLIAPRGRLSDSPTLPQILATPMIEYYFNHQPIQKWLALHYQKRTKKMPIRIYAATAEMVLSLVREGAGIGIVPLYMVSETDKTVRIVRPTARRFTDFIWLLERSSVEPTPVHRAFVQRFHERFQVQVK